MRVSKVALLKEGWIFKSGKAGGGLPKTRQVGHIQFYFVKIKTENLCGIEEVL